MCECLLVLPSTCSVIQAQNKVLGSDADKEHPLMTNIMTHRVLVVCAMTKNAHDYSIRVSQAFHACFVH